MVYLVKNGEFEMCKKIRTINKDSNKNKQNNSSSTKGMARMASANKLNILNSGPNKAEHGKWFRASESHLLLSPGGDRRSNSPDRKAGAN